MIRKINRHGTFLCFILFGVIVFFATRLIAGFFYAQYTKGSFSQQLSGAVIVSLVYIGFYITLLLAVAIAGFFLAKHKKNQEVKIGFVYSFVLSLILALSYIILFFF